MLASTSLILYNCISLSFVLARNVYRTAAPYLEINPAINVTIVVDNTLKLIANPLFIVTETRDITANIFCLNNPNDTFAETATDKSLEASFLAERLTVSETVIDSVLNNAFARETFAVDNTLIILPLAILMLTETLEITFNAFKKAFPAEIDAELDTDTAKLFKCVARADKEGLPVTDTKRLLDNDRTLLILTLALLITLNSTVLALFVRLLNGAEDIGLLPNIKQLQHQNQ